MSCMSGSPNLNRFRDRGQVAVQLVSCGVPLPGLVEDCTQHSCVTLYIYIYIYTYIYIYIYIYKHPQTDCFVVLQLFSVARHVGRLKLGSISAQLYVRLTAQPQATYVSSGIIIFTLPLHSGRI